MSKILEKIKKLEEENEGLQAVIKTIEGRGTDFEELVKSLEGKIEESNAERKALLASNASTKAVDMDSLKHQAADLHLKAVLLGKTVQDMDEYAKFVEYSEKSIVPTDLPSWMAEEFSNELIVELELIKQVEGLFPSFRMPNNRNTFSIPAKTEDVVAYLIAPDAAAIASAVSGNKVSFATKRLKAMVAITDQADHESVTALVQIAKSSLVASISKAMEDALINGDVATVDANSPKKAFDGLRKLSKTAATTVDGGGAAITASVIVDARKVMGVYGKNISDLVVIAPLGVAYDMLKLPEAITMDKYGAKATFVTGEIGKIFGIPVVPSAYIPEDLDAAGVDGGGTLTEVLLVNTRYFNIADRGNLTVEQDRNISTSVDFYVAHRDVDFKPVTVPGKAPAVVTVLNLTK